MEGTLLALIKAVESELARRQMDYKAFKSVVGIHESTWSRIRNGKRPPSFNVLTLLKQRLPKVSKYVEDYMNHRAIPVRQGNDDTIQKGE